MSVLQIPASAVVSRPLGGGGPIQSIPDALEIAMHHLAGCVVGVEGGIAVGKTTLCERIRAHEPQNVSVHAECVPAEALKLFLDPKTRRATAALFQCCMLSTCQTRMALGARDAVAGQVALVDRTPLGNWCFAVAQLCSDKMTDDEYRFYTTWLGSTPLDSVGVVVFLDVPPTAAVDRMRKRNSLTEAKHYDIDYFRLLYRTYVRCILETAMRPGTPPIVIIPETLTPGHWWQAVVAASAVVLEDVPRATVLHVAPGATGPATERRMWQAIDALPPTPYGTGTTTESSTIWLERLVMATTAEYWPTEPLAIDWSDLIGNDTKADAACHLAMALLARGIVVNISGYHSSPTDLVATSK